MFEPFNDIFIDGMTLFPQETFPARISTTRRWLESERVNALRQSTLYEFRGYVVNPFKTGAVPNATMTGTVRTLPNSWLFGIVYLDPNQNTIPPVLRLWNTRGWQFILGLPGSTPTTWNSSANQGSPKFHAIDEPVLLPEGICQWETTATVGDPVQFTLLCAEPLEEVCGDILSFCKDSQAVMF